MAKDLKNCTIIIPVLIEHPDRYNNAKTVLNYINKNFETNVFIYEISENESKLDFLGDLKNIIIKHWVEKPEEAFHRTKYLNIMLDDVETPVVANYDIDVIMKPEVYTESVRMIIEEGVDVLYPYSFGGMTQRKILQTPDIHSKIFDNKLDLNYIDENPSLFLDYYTEYGHCIFFNTNIYRTYGAENENFISYGPEDKERGERFVRLGARVKWNHGNFVYHFEHYRGNDSSTNNPYFIHNQNVHKYMNKMCEDNFLKYEEYYRNPEYSSKYKTIGNKE
jgi:hypothetical protein